MRDFKVENFRFMSTSDYYDDQYKNWSRAYEYPEVIFNIPIDAKTIHNTASGIYPNVTYPYAISSLFHHNLSLFFPDAEVYSSDLVVPFKDRYNFVYDISKPWEHDTRFEVVLCVSVIEHLKSNPIEALKNLMSQCYKNGKVIVTMDYPRVNLKPFEDFLGVECKDTFERLNGMKSKYPNRNYKHLNIVFLDITVL